MRQRKRVLRPWRWRVREVMEEKGLSVNEVAQRAGVRRSTVQAFCRDPQHDTTIDVWSRLAEALGVSRAELIEPLLSDQDQSPAHT